jgi:hypothetical protein
MIYNTTDIDSQKALSGLTQDDFQKTMDKIKIIFETTQKKIFLVKKGHINYQLLLTGLSCCFVLHEELNQAII